MNRLLILGILAVGIIIGIISTPSKTVTKIEYKTPQACKDAISIDNKVFGKMADDLGKSTDITSLTTNLDDITAYINSLSSKRVDLADRCLNG